MNSRTLMLPALLMGVSSVYMFGIDSQRSMPLAADLGASIDSVIFEIPSRTIALSDAEVEVAGVSEYLMRVYEPAGDSTATAGWFSLYVGYYEQQAQGRTIHSPRNCLPGAGWQVLTSAPGVISGPWGESAVNRYIIQNGDQKALVLYWYQGRGRIAANEYVVKWELLRDAAIRKRTEEALVRVVVPLETTEQEAYTRAAGIAGVVSQQLAAALPG